MKKLGKGLSLELALAVICALVAFKASLSHNHKYNTTLLFDSGHYMGTAQYICQAVEAYCRHLPFTPADWEKLSSYLLLDGPLVPVFGSSLFLILGRTPTADNLDIFILFECLFQALAAAMTASLSYRLTRSHVVGALAGLAWALYPAAILGCDSFLGEVPAAALMLLYLRLLLGLIERTSLWQALGAGFTAALIFSSKPALILALISTTLLSLIMRRKLGLKAQFALLIEMALGAAVILAPWMAFSHAATGEYLPTARRQPTFNASKGSDISSDGWGMLPYSLTQKRFPEQYGAAACLITLWKEDPAGSLNLALRKVERLWLTPWNDFHHYCRGLSPTLQIILHRLLLLLAACGLILSPVIVGAASNRNKKAAAFILISAPLVILSHLTYVPFETLARYGFSAMPWFFILAAAALAYCQRKHRLPQLALAMLAGTLALAAAALNWWPILSPVLAWPLTPVAAFLIQLGISALFLQLTLNIATERTYISLGWRATAPLSLPQSLSVFLSLALGLAIGAIAAAHLLYEREAREWTCRLKPGESIHRIVTLEGFKGKNSLLMIDCDQGLAQAAITVNGTRLAEPPVNPMHLIKLWCDLERLQFMFACMHGHSIDKIRQWRVVSIPDGLLKSGMANEITVTAGGPLTIYGAYDSIWGGPAYAHSFNALSTGLLLNDITGSEGRVITRDIRPRPSRCFRDNAPQSSDLASGSGLQSGSYKVFILEQTPSAENENSSYNVY